jgi:SM-20-related protein
MTTPKQSLGFNLLLIRNFFDAETCERILADVRSDRGGPATVYRDAKDAASGIVDERVRRATRLVPCAETVELVVGRLLKSRPAIEEHFGVSISDCEDPQFLRYGVGDFFVAHQDGNTGLIRSDRERARTVSVIIFLSDQSESPRPDTYGGGSLVFHGWGSGMRGQEDLRESVSGEAGTLVAFRSQTTHEVLPVEHGERYSIASWYR